MSITQSRTNGGWKSAAAVTAAAEMLVNLSFPFFSQILLLSVLSTEIKEGRCVATRQLLDGPCQAIQKSPPLGAKP